MFLDNNVVRDIYCRNTFVVKTTFPLFGLIHMFSERQKFNFNNMESQLPTLEIQKAGDLEIILNFKQQAIEIILLFKPKNCPKYCPLYPTLPIIYLHIYNMPIRAYI